MKCETSVRRSAYGANWQYSDLTSDLKLLQTNLQPGLNRLLKAHRDLKICLRDHGLSLRYFILTLL